MPENPQYVYWTSDWATKLRFLVWPPKFNAKNRQFFVFRCLSVYSDTASNRLLQNFRLFTSLFDRFDSNTFVSEVLSYGRILRLYV